MSKKVDLNELSAIHIMGWRKVTHGETDKEYMEESLAEIKEKYGEDSDIYKSELEYFNERVWIDSEGNYDWYVSRRCYEGNENWSPLWDSDQLKTVLEKFLDKYKLILFKDDQYWAQLVEGEISPIGYALGAGGDTINEAILRVCLLVKGVLA